MTSPIVAGFVVSIIFTALSLIHFYWLITGEVNEDAVFPKYDGEPLLTPNRWATLVVAIGLLLFTFITLGRVGLFELPYLDGLFRYGIWGIGFIFLLRAIGDFKFMGFFKTEKNSLFAKWDTRLYAPLCLIIAFLVFVVVFFGDLNA